MLPVRVRLASRIVFPTRMLSLFIASLFVAGCSSGGGASQNQPAPDVSQLSPISGEVGSSITIMGTNFGSTQTQVSGTVIVNAVSATVISWSSTSITVTVPTGATGTGDVVVTVSGVQSNTEAFTVVTSLASISLIVPGPVIFSAGNAESIAILVTNDVTGDVLTPALTVNGEACTTTTCGTLGAVAGTSGSGSYTMSYTPPSVDFTAATTFTLVVQSNLDSFTATTTFIVYPAGVRVVTISGVGQRVLTSSATKSGLAALVYNDTGNAGVTLSLLGSGYACPGTVCGTLTISGAQTTGTTSTGTTGIPFTSLPFSYAPPSSVAAPPYDRPMILAVSNADLTKLAETNFAVTPAATTSLVVPNTSRLNTALTGGAAITLSANLTSDTGTSKTVSWTLQASGANCQPACGNLGTPAYTRNGNNVTATISYTPPPSVPSGQANPTITATSVDNSAATDGFSFNIVNGACGSGNESILSGNYAFLIKGGAAQAGYIVSIGSINANGVNGGGVIKSGFLDTNRTIGPVTGLTLTGTYSIGPDNRGCLALVNSNGGTTNYRIALGKLASGVATQGSMITFVDNTGEGMRTQGFLVQQDPTAFNPGSFTGTYAFAEDGIDSSGGTFVGAGLVTADGVSALTSGIEDFDDTTEGTGRVTGGIFGTYSLATNAPGGRGTDQTMVPLGGGGFSTSNTVFYIVSSSESLSMTIDPLGTYTTIVGVVAKRQTGPFPFTATTLDNAGYVISLAGVDPANGGNLTALQQVTVTTNGAAMITRDRNDNGSEGQEASSSATFGIASNGRTTISPTTGPPLLLYLIDSTQGITISTSSAGGAVFSGYFQKQTGGPYSNTTVPATAFVGGGVRNTGSPYDVEAVSFNTGNTTLSGTDDESSPNGLNPNVAIGSTPYSFTAFANALGAFTPTATGQGFFGGGILAYIVSPTQSVFMKIGSTTIAGFGPFAPSSALSASPAELYTSQK